jgi:hypothetical protein
MRLFNGAMSLPIRQGPLFPEAQVQSPKFGRHLATLKYRFDLAPLFISHVYPQDIRADWAPGRTTLIGVKARVGTFHLDMHQRQQEMLKDRPEFGDSKKKVFHKPFYEAEMDLDKIDLRTLCAQFTEPDKRLFPSDEDPVSAAAEGERDIFAGDCTLSDRDLEWLDIRDFIEVDWKPPESGEDPKVKLAQAMVCPHFNYHRRLESQRERSHRTASQASQSKQSRRATEQQQEEILRLEFTKFGREDSHTCLVGQGPHSFDVQQALGDERISQLHAELDKLCGADRDHEAAASLRKKIQLITTYLSALKHEHRVPDSREPPTAFPVTKGSAGHGSDKLAMPHMYADWESFNNRHLVHNPTIFFSNTTRDVLLKYYLSSRQRRGVVHHLTARAVRYIRELSARHEGEDHEDESKSHADEDADEASDAKRHGSTSSRGSRRRRQQSRKRTRDTDGATPVEEKKAIDLLQGLLTQTANQVMVESPTEDGPDSSLLDDDIDASEGISDQFDVRRSTICVLIKPQIVLRSEMDERSTIVLTATRTRLRNFSVIDPRSEEDSVNERVLHRNYFTLDGLQAFHPSDSCTFLATANERSGFVYVPLETLVDFRVSVQRRCAEARLTSWRRSTRRTTSIAWCRTLTRACATTSSTSCVSTTRPVPSRQTRPAAILPSTTSCTTWTLPACAAHASASWLMRATSPPSTTWSPTCCSIAIPRTASTRSDSRQCSSATTSATRRACPRWSLACSTASATRASCTRSISCTLSTSTSTADSICSRSRRRCRTCSTSSTSSWRRLQPPRSTPPAQTRTRSRRCASRPWPKTSPGA